MPKVSVVIPTFNRAHLVGRAVKSALAQTAADLEVLVVDDASTDGTRDVVLGIGDPRVTYLQHASNFGVSAARNSAIARATGAFIAFLDDDDEWLPDKIRLQLERFEQLPDVGLITTGYQPEDIAGRPMSVVLPEQRGWMFERLLRQGRFDHTSTILVRAECFASAGLFDVDLRFGEDFDMWLRITRAYQVDCVATSLVRVYPQAQGLTENYAARVAGIEAHLAKYRTFFEQNPHIHNDRLHKLATDYCFVGDTRRGRQVFYRAILCRPLAAKSYISAVLSLLGPRALRSCYRFKNWCDRAEPGVSGLRNAVVSICARLQPDRTQSPASR